MNGEGGGVHRVATFNDLSFVIAADQVRDVDLAEMNPERIDPESVAELRVPGGYVACHAFVEAELREQPEGGGEPLLPVQPSSSGVSKTGGRGSESVMVRASFRNRPACSGAFIFRPSVTGSYRHSPTADAARVG
jgi:hypothetical protein